MRDAAENKADKMEDNADKVRDGSFVALSNFWKFIFHKINEKVGRSMLNATDS